MLRGAQFGVTLCPHKTSILSVIIIENYLKMYVTHIVNFNCQTVK